MRQRREFPSVDPTRSGQTPIDPWGGHRLGKRPVDLPLQDRNLDRWRTIRNPREIVRGRLSGQASRSSDRADHGSICPHRMHGSFAGRLGQHPRDQSLRRCDEGDLHRGRENEKGARIAGRMQITRRFRCDPFCLPTGRQLSRLRRGSTRWNALCIER